MKCSICDAKITFADSKLILSETPSPAMAGIYVKRLQALVGGSKVKALTSNICYACWVTKVKESDSQDTMTPEEIEAAKAAVKRADPLRVIHIGRNEPCPCGSGLKYKKCCQSKDKQAV